MGFSCSLRHDASRALLIGAITVALGGGLAVLDERRIFPSSAPRSVPAIPGITVEDGMGDVPMPVVTSLRSDGEAERLGLRVGDRIVAIDDRTVSDVAALERALRAPGSSMLKLRIRRGDAIWTVAIDRTAGDA